jgi:hypothetical protein
MDHPRFIVDVMLGSLARWLGALDLDAAYDRAIEDAELVERLQKMGIDPEVNRPPTPGHARTGRASRRWAPRRRARGRR